MPVLPRRGHEIGEPVEELKWRELDDAIGPRPGGLSAAAAASSRPASLNHRITRRRTRSASAARLACVIGRAGRNGERGGLGGQSFPRGWHRTADRGGGGAAPVWHSAAQVMRSLGEGIVEFKRGVQGIEDTGPASRDAGRPDAR